MAKSRARFLSELLGSTGLVKKSKSALAGADELLDLDVIPSIPNSKLTNASISIAGHSTALGASVTLNTGDIGEHTNYKYFTDARARGSVSVSGDLAYNSTTGVFSFTERTDAEVRGLVSAGGNLSYNSSTGAFSYTTPTTIASLSNHDTADLAEGTNLYFTNARADGRITNALKDEDNMASNSATHIPSQQSVKAYVDSQILTKDNTDEITEGSSNLYYTNARADARITNAGSANWNTAYGWGDHASGGYAPIASPGLTGTPTAPTAATNTNTTQIATTAFVQTELTDLIDGAPGTLDTLNELAAAINDDSNYNSTLTTALATKLPLAGGTMTGNLILSHASSPTLTLQDTTNTVRLLHYAQDANAISGTYSAHPYLFYTNSTLALTLSASQNATFAGTISSGAITSSGNISGSNLNVTSTNWLGWGDYGERITGSNASSSLYFSTNATTALTLDGSQNATFAGYLKLSSHNHIITTNNANNLKITTGGAGASGILLENTGGNFMSQIYGDGTYYGFLDAAWGGWDIKKTKNGQLQIDEGSGLVKVWTAGNDGSGSTLDADLLDGQHGSYYAPVAGSTSFRPVTAGLYGTGHGSSLLPIWQYNSSHPGYGFGYVESSPDSFRFDVSNNLVSGTPDFEISENIARVNGNTVYHVGNDGSGSGLDADLLDGMNSSSSVVANTIVARQANGYIYANHINFNTSESENPTINSFFTSNGDGWSRKSTKAHVISQLGLYTTSNDGSGTGLDADLLDGQHGSYYLNASSINAGTINAGRLPDLVFKSQTNNNGGWSQSNRNFSVRSGGDAVGLHMEESDGTFGFQLYSNNGTYGFLDAEWGDWDIQKARNGTFKVDEGSGLKRVLNEANWSSYITIPTTLPANGGNADTVDNLHAASFLRSDTADTFTGTITMGTQKALVANNYGRGVYGLYSSTNHQHVWSMGTSYNLADNGGSVGNLYGLSYTHTNVGTGYGGNSAAGLGHQLNGRANGTLQWALGDGMWSSVTGSVWGASNDGSGSGLDADYLDGLDLHTGRNNEANKVVRTNASGYIETGYINTSVGTEALSSDWTKVYASTDNYIRPYGKSDFKVRMGLTAHQYDRMDYTSGTQYHTGANSHNDTTFNGLLQRGCGFIDNWNGGAGKPPSGTHWNGFQALHYVSGSSYFHGMQMAMAAGNPSYTYLRGWWANGGSGYGWQKIWTDGNDGSGSGLDADLLDGVDSTSFLRSDVYDTGVGLALNGGTSNHPHDSTLYVTASNNSDWGITVAAASGKTEYGMQIQMPSSFNYALRILKNGSEHFNVNSSGATISGNYIWHAGNDGSGSGLDADTLDGLNLSASTTNNGANLVMRTDANGYANFGWIYTASGAASGTLARIYCSQDGYLRYLSPDNLSGSWLRENVYNNLIDSTGAGGNMNTVFQNGRSGNIDVWSGYNLPSGTSHVQGIQCRHQTTTHYGFQLVNQYNQQQMYHRQISNNVFGAWNKIWSSSTDGSGSGLDADLLDGQQPSTSGGASKIAQYASNGYLYVNNWIRPNNGTGLFYSAGVHFHESGNNMYSTTGYTSANQGTLWGSSNDGSGSGLDADNIRGKAFVNTGSGGGVNADTINNNGISYYTSGVTNFSGNATDGALFSQQYSSSWQHQIAGDYRSGQIALRGKNNGTWQSWRKVWDVSNDGSGSGLDADTLDGSHASSFITTSATNASALYIRNTSPTVYLRDTDHYSSMLHCNSNIFYVLRGAADSTSWAQVGGKWPMELSLSSNSVTFGGNVTAYSDVSLKENIKPIGNSMEMFEQIDAKRFDWIVDGKKDIGFIAQDVQAAGLNEVVIEKENRDPGTGELLDTKLTLDYSRMVSVLWDVVKEQQAQIDELKKLIGV